MLLVIRSSCVQQELRRRPFRKAMSFYHYLIGDKLYAGIFVGRDAR